jgi:hypothetical protein
MRCLCDAFADSVEAKNLCHRKVLLEERHVAFDNGHVEIASPQSVARSGGAAQGAIREF